MNTHNLLGLERKVNLFMAEFCQHYASSDTKMRSLIEACFRKNVDHAQGFALELHTLVHSQAVKNDLLAIYSRAVSRGQPPPAEGIDLLTSGKRPGGPLVNEVTKRQCLQAVPSPLVLNLPTIKQWIEKGDVDVFAKIFALVGGYDRATSEQCVEICNLLIHLLKSESWDSFNAVLFPRDALTPFLLMQESQILYLG